MRGSLRAALLSLAAILVFVALLEGFSGSSKVGSSSTQPAQGVNATPCPSQHATEVPVAGVRTAMIPVFISQPYAVLSTRGGGWSFVSTPSAVYVVSHAASFPKIVRQIPLPAAVAFGVHGLALTADGRYLLASAGSGAVVISVDRAVRGRGQAVLGRLRSGVGDDAGAIAVVASPDGRFAFVARARAGGIAVFDLQAALANGFSTSGGVGAIPTDLGPTGLAMSPDGRWLYVVSAAAKGSGGAAPSTGTLSVIDASRAQTAPTSSVRSTASAGCEPVRVVTSRGGRYVWVAALGSHSVLGFSAAALQQGSPRALVAQVTVGESPYGIVAIAGGRQLLVADSGSGAGGGPSGAGGRRPGISVVDTAAALAGRPALVGSVLAGRYPRDLAVVPGHGAVLVTNYGSGELELVKVAGAL
jgi:DNA-binding beta-propeller fold protein YncE